MKRLTMLVNSHLLDNGKLDKEYDLNNKIKLNEYSCMDVPNAVYNKLGELEDVLEKWHIEDLDKFLEEQITKKRELNNILWKMGQELSELKQKTIAPKFEIGQKVWYIYNNKIKSFIISKIEIEIRIVPLIAYCSPYIYQYEKDIFATKEEAEQKLARIKGEKDD